MEIALKMQSSGRNSVNLHEPEVALAWIKAFKARLQIHNQKEVGVKTNGGNSSQGIIFLAAVSKA